ncbi:hypothetical protein [Actinomycetospora aeridis]|uniref:Uncharacterized protein n=1 Tax=Actinomycetospora aeridis TaxID=3129231 RepID=A0ABU8MZN4_9PSEU
MAERSTTSRAIAVGQLPAATAAFISEQGAVRGLFRDPLAEVTHALRTDETTTRRRLFGGAKTSVRTVEMLLTPDLLVVSYRDGTVDEDLAAQVSFHRLNQIEFAPLPSELLDRAAGAKLAVPAGLMPLTSTPVGSTQRGSRMVPLGDGPDAARFREALLAATERTRRGAGA